jgi:hypothetical protein
MNKMLAYLFGDSQVESELDDCRDALERLFEEADGNPIKASKTPLAKALKSVVGLDVASKLEMDPEGFALLCDDGDMYRQVVDKLTEPVAMEKLAEKGWVAACLGDQAMTGEPADYRIRFIEITTAETTDADKPSNTIANIIKKGREFATTPLEPDPNNPVTHPETPWKKTMGVGKATDGADPKGTPKGSSKKEAREIADELLANPVNESHPEGCQCGFCRNKGKIKDIIHKKNGGAAKDAQVAQAPGQDKVPESIARKRGRPRRIVDMPIAGRPVNHRIPKPPTFGN